MNDEDEVKSLYSEMLTDLKSRMERELLDLMRKERFRRIADNIKKDIDKL